jgi:hypothetical protein
MDYSKFLSRYSSGENEENHENRQSDYMITGPTFEPVASQIQVWSRGSQCGQRTVRMRFIRVVRGTLGLQKNSMKQN